MRPHLLLIASLLPALVAASCYPKGTVLETDEPWTPVDSEDSDADTDTDTDTDTDDTGIPWEERDWPSAQEMFVSFAYPAAQEQAAVEMVLRVMGASQLDDTTWSITHGVTTWTIHIERSAENIVRGLRTPGAVVVYAGHSNYGLGGVFSDLPDLSPIEEIDSVDDFFNFGGPYAAINYAYLRDEQAYPNLVISPDDIAQEPENYLVPILDEERFPNEAGVDPGESFELHGSGSSAYHFSSGENRYLIVNAGSADLPPPEEMVYDVMFVKSCNSGRYYIESFQRGEYFYTTDNVYAEDMVVTMDLFVKHMILRTPYAEIADLMDEREGNAVYEWVHID
jgi:hypothetical protein